MSRGAPVHRLGGKVTNCQIGVFAAYVSVEGYAFVDRALSLSEEAHALHTPVSAGRGVTV